MSLEKFNLCSDIYYNNKYISLYIEKDKELFSFKYQENDNIFINKTIKRPIEKIGNIDINDGFYDLETAYGYGGFYTNSNDAIFINNAMQKYTQKCKDENIVAEFVRFHPFNKFPINHNNHLDFNMYDRNVVVKELSENIMASYNAKVRNSVKRANKKVQIQESENIDKFIELYNTTMEKNDATDFYFFEKKYYINLLKNNQIRLYEVLYQGKAIAMGFFMFSSDIAHYHLSANSDISYKLNSNYALLDTMFHKAQELDIKYFLLGGGTTIREDDPLLKFKTKFSSKLKPFYISGKIYNKEVYTKYNKIWEEQANEDIKYFLKYRLEIV